MQRPVNFLSIISKSLLIASILSDILIDLLIPSLSKISLTLPIPITLYLFSLREFKIVLFGGFIL